MDKTSKIALGIVIAVVVGFVFYIINGVIHFFGYMYPPERYWYKVKTDMALEERYPEHDFEVDTVFGSGEYGYYLNIHATDENGIRFYVQWVDGELEDHYHDAWNEFYYGKSVVEYQNELRDEYMPQIPYVDTYEYSTDEEFDFAWGTYEYVFFESVEEAIEASKYADFRTQVTFKDIDFKKADDAEIERFADSMADSLLWLHERTGYSEIWIDSFHYIEPDEYGGGYKTRGELLDSIMKEIGYKKDR